MKPFCSIKLFFLFNLTLSLLLLLNAMPVQAQNGDKIELRVAVLAFRGDDRAIDRWSSTMQ